MTATATLSGREPACKLLSAVDLLKTPRALTCQRCGAEFFRNPGTGRDAYWCRECRPYVRKRTDPRCKHCSGPVEGQRQACKPCAVEVENARQRARNEERKARRAADARPSPSPEKLRERALAHRRAWSRKRAEAAGRVYAPRPAPEQREAEKTRRIAGREAAKAAARAARVAEKPWLAPGLTAAESRGIRRQLDPEYAMRLRVAEAMRRRTPAWLARKMGCRLRDAAAARKPSRALEERLGYTIEDLCRHIERQFTKGMTWELFQAGAIHLDHIVPLRCFDLSCEEEVRAAWAITNLAPKWPPENQAKAGKRLTLL